MVTLIKRKTEHCTYFVIFFPTVFPSYWFLLIHFFNSKTVFLYCSETTENLLMCNPTYSHLKDYIVNILSFCFIKYIVISFSMFFSFSVVKHKSIEPNIVLLITAQYTCGPADNGSTHWWKDRTGKLFLPVVHLPFNLWSSFPLTP